MSETEDVVISVRPETARLLADPAVRARVALEVDRLARQQVAAMLREAIDRLASDAHARGLTDDIVDEELAAHKAERRARRNTTAA